MKLYWSWKLAAWTLVLLLALALLPACFEITQNLTADGTALLLGLPFGFYTILITSAGSFAIHLNAAALAADAFILYCLLVLLQTLLRGMNKQ